MTQWFSLHHFPLAKLREYTVKKLGTPCELIKAAATRFGTNTLVGERLMKLKGSLQATCTDEEYVARVSHIIVIRNSTGVSHFSQPQEQEAASGRQTPIPRSEVLCLHPLEPARKCPNDYIIEVTMHRFSRCKLLS